MNKIKIILSIALFASSLALLVVSAFLAENAYITPIIAIVLIVVSFVFVFIATFHLAKVDYETGVYECRKCGHIFKPTFKAYLFGAHTLTTRCLKCPECERKSWCKRIVEKA